MITQKLGLAMLAIAASIVWTGCDSKVQPGAKAQTVAQPEQKKVAPPVVRRDIESEAKSRLIQLMTLETVQKDLGLSADQINITKENVKTFKDLSEEFWAKYQEILPRSIPAEEYESRDRKFQPVWDEMERKAKELATKTLAILTPDQIKRLKQIQIQAAIPAALGSPEIIKALGISDEQSKRIRDVGDAVDSKIIPPFRGNTPDERRRSTTEWYKTSRKVWKEATPSLLDILTPEQRAKFDILQGKKIEVERRDEEWIPKDFPF